MKRYKYIAAINFSRASMKKPIEIEKPTIQEVIKFYEELKMEDSDVQGFSMREEPDLDFEMR